MDYIKKMILVWTNIGPYHVARLEATQKLSQCYGYQILGLEFAGKELIYPWIRKSNCDNLLTLFPEFALHEISNLQYLIRIWQFLNQKRPDVLALSGYSHMAMLAALAWGRKNRKIVILMTASKEDDKPRKRWKEWLKRQIVQQFDAALVGGTPHVEYAKSLGMPDNKIFMSCDVVDNNHYAKGAIRVQEEEAKWRSRLSLFNPFFLTVARFIKKKNLFRLIIAYRQYREANQGNPWDLVICGSGPLEEQLKEHAKNLPGIHFPGFKQADEITPYYGLAKVFIMPSSHYEQWGLVVNEAMAAGLPVLVSRACGCAQDLVKDGINGFIFNPFNVAELGKLMAKMSSGQVDLKAMGEASQRIIAGWGPEFFAKNLFKAAEAARSHYIHF